MSGIYSDPKSDAFFMGLLSFMMVGFLAAFLVFEVRPRYRAPELTAVDYPYIVRLPREPLMAWNMDVHLACERMDEEARIVYDCVTGKVQHAHGELQYKEYHLAAQDSWWKR